MTRFLLAALFLLSPATLAAQSLPDWAAPSGTVQANDVPLDAVPPPPPPPPVGVPIDGGLALLALAGAGLAARKLRRA